MRLATVSIRLVFFCDWYVIFSSHNLYVVIQRYVRGQRNHSMRRSIQRVSKPESTGGRYKTSQIYVAFYDMQRPPFRF